VHGDLAAAATTMFVLIFFFFFFAAYDLSKYKPNQMK